MIDRRRLLTVRKQSWSNVGIYKMNRRDSRSPAAAAPVFKLNVVTVTRLLALIVLVGSPSFAAAQSSRGADSGATTAIAQKAGAILRRMTLGEKLAYIGGTDGYFIRAIPRLGLRALRMSDGPIGVDGHGPSTAYGGGVALAASWDPLLASQLGTQIGEDARARGFDFLLGPGVNIYRMPLNGRNFEYFGEDPLLASRIAVAYIQGVQSQGVCAVVKHYVISNSEFDPHSSPDIVIGVRALREIYLPPFEAAIKDGHVCGVMDAYDELNGAHMTENREMNLNIAKREWGFKGIIISDWNAAHDGLAAASGGLDLEMPSAKHMTPEVLRRAIDRHELSIEALDDKVFRILRLAVRFGWFKHPAANPAIPLFRQQARAVALRSSEESIVLLKNAGGVLPLDQKAIKSILVVGPNAYPAAATGGGSAWVEPLFAVSPLEGILQKIGDTAEVYYRRGLPSFSDLANATDFVTTAKGGTPGLQAETFSNAEFSGAPTTSSVVQHVNFTGQLPEEITHVDFASVLKPTPTANRWTGYYIPARAGTYDIFVEGGGFESTYRLYVDDRLVIDCWRGIKAVLSQIKLKLSAGPHKIVLESFRPVLFGGLRLRLGIARTGTLVDPVARELAAKVDAVIVVAGYDRKIERETGDRDFDLPLGQATLIRDMSLANRKTVVAIQSGGSFATRGWLGNVPALLEAWYGGQEVGAALAETLFGDVNPSGHLPFTFERTLADDPALNSYYPDPRTGKVVYRDGIFVGYRGFAHRGIKPLFPFGYGLSYTTFHFSNLRVDPVSGTKNEWQASFDVTNTGRRAGMQVAQLYIAEPDAKEPRPPEELKGFKKIKLLPRQTQQVTLQLGPRAFSYFDPVAGRWRIGSKRFEVLVGSSSAQIELRQTISLRDQ